MPVAAPPQPTPQQKIEQGVKKATATLSKAATSLPQVVQQAVKQHDSMTKLRDKQIIDLVANAHVAQVTATDKIQSTFKPIVEQLDKTMKEAQALPDSDPTKIQRIGYLAHLHGDAVGAIKQQMQAIQQSQQSTQAIMADPKNRKLLSKAVGYDEKQANSPERQMMVAAINAGMQQIQQGAKKALASLPPPVPQQQGEGPNPNINPGAMGGGDAPPTLPGSAAQPPNVQQGTPKWGQMSGKQKIARVAEILGTIAMPQQMQLIPGTPQNKQLLQQKALALKEQVLKMQQDEAVTDFTKAQTGEAIAKTGAETLTPASQEEADTYGVPVGTMLNAASRAALAKQKGINVTKVATTGMTDQTRKDVAQLKPQQRDDRAIAIMQKQQAGQPVTADDKSYLAAYNLWTKQTKIDPGIARAVAFGANRYIPVVDPNDPEKVTIMRAADASKADLGTPASIAFQTDKALTRAFTSGQPAQTINYFNTATEHLKQLQDAADALNNGDVQAFNKLGNAWATATGNPAPTNFAAIKNAVAGELSKTFKGAAATDAEIDAINTAINSTQSPAQLSGAIASNIRLMGSKMEALRGQYEAGKQGKPNFPGAGGGIPAGAPTATDSKGNKVYYDGKSWIPAK
jgi:hypothetical protein